MGLKYHPYCDGLFGRYMRLIYLSEKDDKETRELYHREANYAWNELLRICRQYYSYDPDADVICQSLDIYRLHEVCCDYFSRK